MGDITGCEEAEKKIKHLEEEIAALKKDLILWKDGVVPSQEKKLIELEAAVESLKAENAKLQEIHMLPDRPEYTGFLKIGQELIDRAEKIEALEAQAAALAEALDQIYQSAGLNPYSNYAITASDYSRMEQALAAYRDGQKEKENG